MKQLLLLTVLALYSVLSQAQSTICDSNITALNLNDLDNELSSVNGIETSTWFISGEEYAFTTSNIHTKFYSRSHWPYFPHLYTKCGDELELVVKDVINHTYDSLLPNTEYLVIYKSDYNSSNINGVIELSHPQISPCLDSFTVLDSTHASYMWMSHNDQARDFWDDLISNSIYKFTTSDAQDSLVIWHQGDLIPQLYNGCNSEPVQLKTRAGNINSPVTGYSYNPTPNTTYYIRFRNANNDIERNGMALYDSIPARETVDTVETVDTTVIVVNPPDTVWITDTITITQIDTITIVDLDEFIFNLNGSYTIIESITIECMDTVTSVSEGILDPNGDEPIYYYNLSGQEVSHREPGMIYIGIQGNIVQKVIIY